MKGLALKVDAATKERIFEPRLGFSLGGLGADSLVVAHVLGDRVDHIGASFALVADSLLKEGHELILKVPRLLRLSREESLGEVSSARERHLLLAQLGEDSLILAGMLVSETDNSVRFLDLVLEVNRVADRHQRLGLSHSGRQRVHANDSRVDEANRNRTGTVMREIDEEVLLHLVVLRAEEVILLKAGEEPDDLASAQGASRLVGRVFSDDRIEDLQAVIVLDRRVDLSDNAKGVSGVFSDGGELVRDGLSVDNLDWFLNNLPVETGDVESLLSRHEAFDDSAKLVPGNDAVTRSHVIGGCDFVRHVSDDFRLAYLRLQSK